VVGRPQRDLVSETSKT